jgi:hypothetical protein
VEPPEDDGIAFEIVWILNNLCSCSNEFQIDYLVKQGILRVMMQLIHDQNSSNEMFESIENVLVRAVKTDDA